MALADKCTRNQGILRVANDTPTIRRQGVYWRLRYSHDDAPGWVAGEDARGEGRACSSRKGTVRITSRTMA